MSGDREDCRVSIVSTCFKTVLQNLAFTGEISISFATVRGSMGT